MNEIKSFTGGAFATNCFLLRTEAGSILVDAPEGCGGWLRREGEKVDYLLLTHGHYDHVTDAAEVKRTHGCRVGYHPETPGIMNDRDFFAAFGLQLEAEPVEADDLLESAENREILGTTFRILEVPGHCPGSLCLYQPDLATLFGGDVLFAGGIGRWDLPGGDFELLIAGIREKVLPLGDDVAVLPGHGPATTVGRERTTNPFLAPGAA
jgi:glyoxylase-like metal-dependent hydrolase (beta-lactamase superfamily II)